MGVRRSKPALETARRGAFTSRVLRRGSSIRVAVDDPTTLWSGAATQDRPQPIQGARPARAGSGRCNPGRTSGPWLESAHELAGQDRAQSRAERTHAGRELEGASTRAFGPARAGATQPASEPFDVGALWPWRKLAPDAAKQLQAIGEWKGHRAPVTTRDVHPMASIAERHPRSWRECLAALDALGRYR